MRGTRKSCRLLSLSWTSMSRRWTREGLEWRQVVWRSAKGDLLSFIYTGVGQLHSYLAMPTMRHS